MLENGDPGVTERSRWAQRAARRARWTKGLEMTVDDGGKDPQEVVRSGSAHIAEAPNVEEIWERLWWAVRELCPRATAIRVYRGVDASIRLVWSSDLPRDTDLVFTVRGWGPRLRAILDDPDQPVDVGELFGEDVAAARESLRRLLSGRGGPLVLENPARQIRVFVDEDEFRAVKEFLLKSGPPGQEVLCPVVVDERLELVVFVRAPPGEKPFTPELASDIWQLVLLSREVMARLENAALVRQYEGLALLYREALLGMARAEDLQSLYSEAGSDLLRGTGAGGLAVFSKVRPDQVEWSRHLGKETVTELRRVVEEMLHRGGTQPEPIFVSSTGADEIVAELGASPKGVEAMAVVPAYLGGMHVATLVLTWPEPRQFSLPERALVEFLGIGFSLALSNHHLERSLRVVRNRARRMAEAVDQGLLRIDSEGKIRFINALAVQLLGIGEAETRRRALLGLVAPQLREQLIPILEAALTGEDSQVSIAGADGRRLRIRVQVDDEVAYPGESRISTWSIVEESEAEQRRQRLEKLFDSTSEAILDLAPDGTVLGANPAARRFLEQIETITAGTRMPEAEPTPVWKILGRQDLEALEHGSVVHKTGETPRPGGSPLAWDAEFSAVETAGNFNILAIVRDRTERQVLAAARKTIQRFGDALVELRTSMTRVHEVLGRGHDLATAVMVQEETVQSRLNDPDIVARAFRSVAEMAQVVAGEAPGDRRILDEIERQLDAIHNTLRGVIGLSGRSAWIITDRPWRSETLVQELEQMGWHCRAVLPNDPLSHDRLPEPGVVILDVGSLTTAVSVYGRIREMHPNAGILLATPLGGAADGFSEDPRLRIVDSIPNGAELQSLLSGLARNSDEAS